MSTREDQINNYLLSLTSPEQQDPATTYLGDLAAGREPSAIEPVKEGGFLDALGLSLIHI